MNARMKYKLGEIGLKSLKIMIGSSCAMFIAMELELAFASSAAVIALLTIVTTKLETLRLSLYRVITYFVSVILCWGIFLNIENIWIAYGVFVFIIIFFCEIMQWGAAISVNVVIGTHFLSTLDFSIGFILNEFLLVLIGIAMAIIFGFYRRTSYSEERLIHNMKYTENEFRSILNYFGSYLDHNEGESELETDLIELQEQIEHFIEQACEYNNNTFKKEGDYYEHYFEMRLRQLGILQNLHTELLKIEQASEETHIVSQYIYQLQKHVLELNNPRKQIEELKIIFTRMLDKELPLTKEEFEARAKAYHMLMYLEEFLTLKMNFVETVNHSMRYKKDYHNTQIYKEELLKKENQ